MRSVEGGGKVVPGVRFRTFPNSMRCKRIDHWAWDIPFLLFTNRSTWWYRERD
jgi:hypothetical protein